MMIFIIPFVFLFKFCNPSEEARTISLISTENKELENSGSCMSNDVIEKNVLFSQRKMILKGCILNL